ncbi:MAG: AAA family ATPase [Methanobrevibacter arboriphilus]|uniref:AAA family ATPase n=1 Tax=Methanobrevibacter arboriphilus TaxID=39441 RepID=A0A843AGD8_METAZ|nr:AAA family ATPase [Methanobrevibacter arboriphilus]MBF4468831.1 AAA family ATPase [Methanobrevibacter arboriphilus]
MGIELENRDKGSVPIKILVYGRPGHGKSTFVSNYCKEHGLKQLVMDFDITNFTGDKVAKIDTSNAFRTRKSILKTIKDMKEDGYDTLVLDGVGKLLKKLTHTEKGLAKYPERSNRFNEIVEEIDNQKLNIIFIGQEDTNLDNYSENLPNSSIQDVNNIVNFIYKCHKDNAENYTVSLDKERKELKNTDNPKKNNTNNNDMVAGNYLQEIKKRLGKDNPTKVEVVREIKEMKKQDDELTDVMKTRILNLV